MASIAKKKIPLLLFQRNNKRKNNKEKRELLYTNIFLQNTCWKWIYFFLILNDCLLDWFQRESKREREKYQWWARIIDMLPPAHPVLGIELQPGMCPNQESNCDLPVHGSMLNYRATPTRLEPSVIDHLWKPLILIHQKNRFIIYAFQD